MTDQTDLRAGDDDRDRTVTVLREAYAQGRLTHEEFESRIDLAHEARTFGDLAALTSDLPATSSAPRTVGESASSEEVRRRAGLRAAWGA